MAPYNPPITFYSQVAAMSNKQDMLRFIGKNGCNLKKVTDSLGLEYIWWNMEKNVVELWGPHNKLTRAKNKIENYLVNFK